MAAVIIGKSRQHKLGKKIRPGAVKLLAFYYVFYSVFLLSFKAFHDLFTACNWLGRELLG